MHEQPDIHARLMAVYPQVPEWWYAIIFITMFVFGVVAIEVWDTKFPVQYFILALVICEFFFRCFFCISSSIRRPGRRRPLRRRRGRVGRCRPLRRRYPRPAQSASVADAASLPFSPIFVPR